MNIRPVHHSIRKALKSGLRFRPRDMESLQVDHEQYEALQRIALDIFADCTNIGIPFQETLAAVYLSGLQHGSELKQT